jgi:hypothetical protein
MIKPKIEKLHPSRKLVGENYPCVFKIVEPSFGKQPESTTTMTVCNWTAYFTNLEWCTNNNLFKMFSMCKICPFNICARTDIQISYKEFINIIDDYLSLKINKGD